MNIDDYCSGIILGDVSTCPKCKEESTKKAKKPDKFKTTYKQLKEEALEKLENVTDDTEIGHKEEDAILCDLLIKLGFKEVVDKYQSTQKWYS